MKKVQLVINHSLSSSQSAEHSLLVAHDSAIYAIYMYIPIQLSKWTPIVPEQGHCECKFQEKAHFELHNKQRQYPLIYSRLLLRKWVAIVSYSTDRIIVSRQVKRQKILQIQLARTRFGIKSTTYTFALLHNA